MKRRVLSVSPSFPPNDAYQALTTTWTEAFYSFDLKQNFGITGQLDADLYTVTEIPESISYDDDVAPPMFADDDNLYFLKNGGKAVNKTSLDNDASIDVFLYKINQSIQFDDSKDTFIQRRYRVGGSKFDRQSEQGFLAAFDDFTVAKQPENLGGVQYTLSSVDQDGVFTFKPEQEAGIINWDKDENDEVPVMDQGNLIYLPYGKRGVLIAVGGIDVRALSRTPDNAERANLKRCSDGIKKVNIFGIGVLPR